MSDYDFILDGVRFSYSSTSTFDTCAYSFKLAYIEMMPRENNFFSDYGLLVHDCLEKYFTKSLESYELSKYYRDNWDSFIKSEPPTNQMLENYRMQGENFFDNFSFNIEDYEVLLVEDKINFKLNGIDAVAKPDLVMKDNKRNKTFLYDYKTALPFWKDKNGKEKEDTKKIDAYFKQMYIYTHALRVEKNIPIDGIYLWFPRGATEHYRDWSLENEEESIKWFGDTIARIKTETVYPYDNSNSFFCDNLCGVRKFCEYR